MSERLLTGWCWHVYPSPRPRHGSWSPGGDGGEEGRRNVSLHGTPSWWGGFIEWNTSLELLSHPPTVYHGASSKCGGHKSRLPPDGFTWVSGFLKKNHWFIADLSLWSLFLSLFATFCTTSVLNVSSVTFCQNLGDFLIISCVLMFVCDIIAGASDFRGCLPKLGISNNKSF